MSQNTFANHIAGAWTAAGAPENGSCCREVFTAARALHAARGGR